MKYGLCGLVTGSGSHIIDVMTLLVVNTDEAAQRESAHKLRSWILRKPEPQCGRFILKQVFSETMAGAVKNETHTILPE